MAMTRFSCDASAFMPDKVLLTIERIIDSCPIILGASWLQTKPFLANQVKRAGHCPALSDHFLYEP